MKKPNLNVNDILDKEFKVDFKGYSAAEVDAFLDQILDDYYTYEENVEELQSQIADLKTKLQEAQKGLTELEGKQKVIDLSNTTSYSSVDLLKRVSHLEEGVYNIWTVLKNIQDEQNNEDATVEQVTETEE